MSSTPVYVCGPSRSAIGRFGGGLSSLSPADLGVPVAAAAVERAGARPELIDETIGDRPLYITFDLDCLDPMVAPGVANIEAGIEGFGIDQVMELLRCVRGKDIIGGDVVCLMPTVDSPNQITSYRSMAIMFEILSLIADRHHSAAQDPPG